MPYIWLPYGVFAVGARRGVMYAPDGRLHNVAISGKGEGEDGRVRLSVRVRLRL